MKIHLLSSFLVLFLLIFSSCKNDNNQEKASEKNETELSNLSEESKKSKKKKTDFSKLSKEEKEDFNTSLWVKIVSFGDTNSFSRSSVSAGLSDYLIESKDITVFAPSNEAFEALIGAQKDILQNPTKLEDLKTLLKSHIISENISSVDLVSRLKDADQLEFETLTGSTIKVVKEDMDLYLQTGEGERAKIIMSDVEASNGYLHVIDNFLFFK